MKVPFLFNTYIRDDDKLVDIGFYQIPSVGIHPIKDPIPSVGI